MKVVVQQGEGEPREVVGVRTISEQTLDGEGVSELLVLRLNPARRDRGAIGAAKERAERKPPATKDA